MTGVQLQARDRVIFFPRRPLVMGIVNINDDSFSGDGTLDQGTALQTARGMARNGADVIDVGAESARTNRAAIECSLELARLRPFVEAFDEAMAAESAADNEQVWPPLLSINTWRPEVAAGILPVGGHLLNDMGGLPEPSNAGLCAQHRTALLIMHSVGEPKIPHLTVTWEDPVEAMERFFREKMSLANDAGVRPEAIVLDPGIDFAKQRDDNLRIYRHLDRLKGLKRPLLLPVSRKTVIGDVLDLPDPRQRDPGTIACLAAGFLRGASIIRVHNVPAAFQALRVLHALESEPNV
jgi:dihydropteroate synthase